MGAQESPQSIFQTICLGHCFKNHVSRTPCFKRLVPGTIFQTICLGRSSNHLSRSVARFLTASWPGFLPLSLSPSFPPSLSVPPVLVSAPESRACWLSAVARESVFRHLAANLLV